MNDETFHIPKESIRILTRAIMEYLEDEKRESGELATNKSQTLNVAHNEPHNDYSK